MTIAKNQDFITIKGDDVLPIFTVYSDYDALTPQDISTVSQIEWFCRRDEDSAVLFTKKKSLGQITFVNTGLDGKFQVQIDAADTATLDGYYLHYARITDSTGKITTVSVGRMQVGLQPEWTYDSSILDSSTVNQVRRLVGDVIANDQQLDDNEIALSISLWPGSIWRAASECCRWIASQYSRKVDSVAPGELRTSFSAQATAYSKRADEYERNAMLRSNGAAQIYAGGISRSDKQTQEADTDRVQPQFNIGMDDNLTMPVPPVGNEIPDTAGTSPLVGNAF